MKRIDRPIVTFYGLRGPVLCMECGPVLDKTAEYA